MSSTTSRVALYKPAGGENVNVTTDLNNNYDKIDTNLNFRVAATATARNAISPFWAGLNVRDTDTGRTWVSNGTAPISGSWSQIPNTGSTLAGDLDLAAGFQVNVGGASSTAAFATVMSASGSDAITARVTGDTQSRYLVNADGKTFWGSGAATQDTNLYRSAANLLKTDDSLEVAVNLAVTGNSTLTGDLSVGGIGQSLYAQNTANQTVTSSTTMVNATNLVFAMSANGVYAFQAVLMTSGGSNAGDIKIGFTMPTGARIDYGGTGLADSVLSGTQGVVSTQAYDDQSSPTTFLPFAVSTSFNQIVIFGQCRMSSTAGNFQLQFAQLGSSATGTVLRARSYMTAQRVA